LFVGGIFCILYLFFSLIYWNQSEKSLLIFLSAMSIETKISINKIKCQFPVIEILNFNSPLFLHLFGKDVIYYFFCQLEPKSCKKSTLVYRHQIPTRSSEIRVRRHYVCDWSGRTCTAHQLSSFSTASAWWNDLPNLHFYLQHRAADKKKKINKIQNEFKI